MTTASCPGMKRTVSFWLRKIIFENNCFCIRYILNLMPPEICPFILQIDTEAFLFSSLLQIRHFVIFPIFLSTRKSIENTAVQPFFVQQKKHPEYCIHGVDIAPPRCYIDGRKMSAGQHRRTSQKTRFC